MGSLLKVCQLQTMFAIEFYSRLSRTAHGGRAALGRREASHSSAQSVFRAAKLPQKRFGKRFRNRLFSEAFMAKTKGQNYMHGAAILTVGVIIMKILGFFYKIPLGNILGDEGYSMFMGAYSIYFIFFTFLMMNTTIIH